MLMILVSSSIDDPATDRLTNLLKFLYNVFAVELICVTLVI